MSYQLTDSPDVVVRLDDGFRIPRGHRWWSGYEAWVAEGNSPEPVPSPTLAEAAAALSVAVQGWLDSTAQANGYDSLASCISYRGSSVSQWDADALAALSWRDAVWQACFQWQQEALTSQTTAFPAADDLISQLPQPAQFGWVSHAPGAPTT